MPSTLIIANPVAGKGAGAARARTLRKLLARESEVELVQTSGRGDATELAATHGADRDRVIAVGGDGTLNEVLTGVLRLGESADERPALGFLPGGTANVATRAFGFATKPAILARRLATSAAGSDPEGRPVDVGMAEIGGTKRPFLLWCGAGLDAVAIEALNATRTGRMGPLGLALRAPQVASALSKYPAPHIHLTVDGARLAEAHSVLLSNVAPIAVGGTVDAAVDPFDGRLDVITSEGTGMFEALRLGAHMLREGLTSAAGVGHHKGVAIDLASEGIVPVQLDGEPVGALPVFVQLLPAAVRLLVD